jgi:hypothetical protein
LPLLTFELFSSGEDSRLFGGSKRWAGKERMSRERGLLDLVESTVEASQKVQRERGKEQRGRERERERRRMGREREEEGKEREKRRGKERERRGGGKREREKRRGKRE